MHSANDYRLCSRASLQIMKDRRQELYNKCLFYDTKLYTALHESNAILRNLRFQYTVVDWIDSHWSSLQGFLVAHPELTTYQKKDITLFFAKYYSDLILDIELNELFSKLGSSGLLMMQKTILLELINTAERWEENSRRLLLEMKKHEEEYNDLLTNLDNKQVEEM